MKFVFFVITFASIYDRVLPLIEEKKGEGEIIVVTTTNQIEQFFKNYTDFKVIRTKVHPDLITRKTKYKLISNIIRSKFEYSRLFKDIKGAEIYFCNLSWAIVIYSYIKKLSKRNKIFFYGHSPNQDEGYIKYPAEMSFRAFVMRLVAKWLLGLDTFIYNNMDVPFWHLDKKFFENINVIENYVGDKKPLEKYMKKLDFLKGKKILIAVEDSVAAGTIEKSEFIDKMDQMIEILDSVSPGAYAIKPHPRLDRLYGKMSQCTEIVPPYIPIEFILNHDWKAVIGVNSWSIIQASRLTNAKVISLIDSIKFTDDKIKKMFRNWIDEESQKKIKFLGEVEELEQILKRIKRSN